MPCMHMQSLQQVGWAQHLYHLIVCNKHAFVASFLGFPTGFLPLPSVLDVKAGYTTLPVDMDIISIQPKLDYVRVGSMIHAGFR